MWNKDNIKNHKGMLGLKHKPETIEKMKKIAKLRGNNYVHINFIGKKRPQEVINRMKATMFRKGQIPYNKGKPNLKMRGENHPNWKGGITPANKLIRRSIEYKLWRESVFKRDNWTCIWCFVRGGVLHADHIKSFALFPELRFAIDNGRTLCKSCHLKTDTWGNNKFKLNTK